MRSTTASLSAVVMILILAACQEPDEPVPHRDGYSESHEVMRVTSPNGRLDAVLVAYEYGGAAGGGVDSNVYIVLKGTPIRIKSGHPVFSADPMTAGDLVWKGDYFLDIHYDVANIHHFRNEWGLYEVEKVGSSGEGNYEVEIRLVPTSATSLLTPTGDLRKLY